MDLVIQAHYPIMKALKEIEGGIGGYPSEASVIASQTRTIIPYRFTQRTVPPGDTPENRKKDHL